MPAVSDDYWNGFIATASFMEPHAIEGVLEWLDRQKTTAGDAPLFLLRLDSGQGVKILATQARLLEELTRKRPRVGDRIRITYTGEAKKAPPGMNPTKEFTVDIIQRKDPAPSGGTGKSRGSASENATGGRS